MGLPLLFIHSSEDDDTTTTTPRGEFTQALGSAAGERMGYFGIKPVYWW